MSLTSDMNVDTSFKKLLPTIKNIYKTYEYTGISFEEYSELVLKVLADLKLTDSISDIRKGIRKEVEIEVRKLLLDKDRSIDVISRYIDQKIPSVSNYDEAVKAIKKLDTFFKKHDFVLELDSLTKLIEGHEKFLTMVNYVFLEKQEDIIKGNSNDVFDSDFLVFSVLTYCSLKGISVLEKNDDLNADDFYDTNSKDIDTIRLYFNEIARIPLLTADEEKELAYKVSMGDKAAHDKFVESNLRLVVNRAKKYRDCGLSFMDLIQEGNCGLMIAVDKFDASKNVRFSTYAIYRISIAMSRAIANNSRMIRLPVHKFNMLKKYNAAVGCLEKEYGRSLGTEEIASLMGKSLKYVREMEKLNKDSISLNCLVAGDDSSELEYFVSTGEDAVEDQVVSKDLSTEINTLLENCKLSEKHLMVLLLRYGILDGHAWTLSELGKKYGVSREWARQLEAKALKIVRSCKETDSFSVYLDNPDRALIQLKKFREDMGKKKSSDKDKDSGDGKKGKSLKTIYEYFGEYEREDIDSVLGMLDENDMSLIALRYGEDLENPVSYNFSEKQASRFYGVLVPKIRKHLEELNPSVEVENDSCDEGLSNDRDICDDFSRDDYIKLINIIRTPEYKWVLDGVGLKNTMIMSLYFGLVEGKQFSTKAISKFFHTTPDDIENDITSNLESNRREFDFILEEASKRVVDDQTDTGLKILVKASDTKQSALTNMTF